VSDTPLPNAPEPAQPVTVIVRRRVRAGHEVAYEKALHALLEDAKAVPGFMGTTVQRPTAGAIASREYVSVVRFATVQHLRAFEQSALRERFTRDVAPHVEADALWQELTGLEFWFSAPAGTVAPQPSKLRMALVMIAVVFTLVLVIGQAIGMLLASWPFALRLLVTITIEVFFMTYWLMPRLTRWLAPWIYPRTKRADAGVTQSTQTQR
jgi:uncharacterized protein